MVDHNHVGRLRFFARTHDKAFFVVRAIAAQTILACRCDLLPHHRVIGNIRPLGFVTAFDVVQILADAFEVRRIVAPHQSPIHQGAVKVVVTDVIRAPFEQGNGHGCAERIADGWQIALEQLVLQGFSPRGNNCFTAP